MELLNNIVIGVLGFLIGFISGRYLNIWKELFFDIKNDFQLYQNQERKNTKLLKNKDGKN